MVSASGSLGHQNTMTMEEVMQIKIRDGYLKTLMRSAKRKGERYQDVLERECGLRDCPEDMVWSEHEAVVVLAKYQLDVRWRGQCVSVPFEGEAS